jgi:hypothetical protein
MLSTNEVVTNSATQYIMLPYYHALSLPTFACAKGILPPQSIQQKNTFDVHATIETESISPWANY